MKNIILRIILLAAASAASSQSSAEIIGGFDCGYEGTRYLSDVNRDGAFEYCRTVGDEPNTYVTCTRGLPGGYFQQGDEIRLLLKYSKGNEVCPARNGSLKQSVKAPRAFPRPMQAAPFPDLPPPPPSSDFGALPPPPPRSPAPPPHSPTPKQAAPAPAPSKPQSADGCVSQSLVGPIKYWKYYNKCEHTVEITVTRTCYDLNNKPLSREATERVPGKTEVEFNREFKFGSFCGGIGHDLTKGITKQAYIR